MKKVVRWIAWLFALPLLLASSAVLILYLPPVQQGAARWGARWLQQHTEYSLTFDRARCHFPLRLQVDGLCLTYGTDTMAWVSRMRCDVSPSAMCRGYIGMGYLQVDGIAVHADSLLPNMQLDASLQHLRLEDVAYAWSNRSLQLDDISLHDAKIAITQATVTKRDSISSSALPLSVVAAKALVTDCAIHYHSASQVVHCSVPTLSLNAIAADTLSVFSLHDACLEHGILHIASKDKARAVIDLSEITICVDSILMSNDALNGTISALSFREAHGLVLKEGEAHLEFSEDRIECTDLTLRTESSHIEGDAMGYNTETWTAHAHMMGTIGYTDMQHLAGMYPDILAEAMTYYPQTALTVEVTLDGPFNSIRLSCCHIAVPALFDVDICGSIDGLPSIQNLGIHTILNATIYDSDVFTALLDTAVQQQLTIPRDLRLEGLLDYSSQTLQTHLTLSFDEDTIAFAGSYNPHAQHYALAIETPSLNIHRIWPSKSLGRVTMQATVIGTGYGWNTPGSQVDCSIIVDSLVWADRLYRNALLTGSLHGHHLHLEATYADTMAHIELRGEGKIGAKRWNINLCTTVTDADLKALGITDTDIRPSFKNHLTVGSDTVGGYFLQTHFQDIVLATPEHTLHPMDMEIRGAWGADSLALSAAAGDLYLSASAHGARLPSGDLTTHDMLSDYLAIGSTLRLTLHAGNNNPISNYLSLSGISINSATALLYQQGDSLIGKASIGTFVAQEAGVDTAMLEAFYHEGMLEARLQANTFTWDTGMMTLGGTLGATLVWHDAFRSDSIQGIVQLSDLEYRYPTYSVYLHTADTVRLPFQEGRLLFPDVAVYAAGKQPLRVNGEATLLTTVPTLQLKIDAHDVSLIQRKGTTESLLYGTALAYGSILLEGPIDALRLSGNVNLRDGTSLCYIYKDASLTANRSLDEVVTFVDFAAPKGQPAPTRQAYQADGFSMNLNVDIVSTAQLQVLLGTNGENRGNMQGGGNMNVQYIPATGLRLSGRYTIAAGELKMNIPLVHVHSLTLRPGGTVQWSGNALNPTFDVVAEDRIRTSVTIDDVPQSILFVAGLSLSDTMERLGVQFTLSAPENASMQNTLAALSPEERSKLAMTLLTTGLYLGEGGTGNLMNTALLGFLQSQLDNISRDAFRSVDVSLGIESLQDGVSGISTRTGYSFSLAKRFWRDRIRIVVGGSVTTSNERIEDNAIIDNISVEWRITPNGNQNLRFFYDKNFESILEGEIRETGIGYVYRRKF